MPDTECNKSRIINLDSECDPHRAVKILQQQGLCAIHIAPRQQIIVGYQLPQHVLADVLQLLKDSGCELESNNWQRWRLALISYSEEIQLHNMMEAAPASNHTREAFVQNYQQHKHGDSDETPEDLRYDR